LNDAEEQAEQAVDLFEKHLGPVMPDTSYDIEIGYDSRQDHEYGEHGVPIAYELEPSEESEIEGNLQLSGSHLIFGESEDAQLESEALVNEFDSRYEDSTVEAES